MSNSASASPGVCIAVCLHDCMSAFLGVCISVCLHDCIYVRVCKCVFVHDSVCMSACLFDCLPWKHNPLWDGANNEGVTWCTTLLADV